MKQTSRREFVCLVAGSPVLVIAGCSTSDNAPVETEAAAIRRSEPIIIKTGDDWSLGGDPFKPSGKPRGLVVLLHQRGGSADDWQKLSLALQAAGFLAVAVDARGTGRSTQGPGQIGSRAPWNTTNDIHAVLVWTLQGKMPVGLVGASYGANNAIIYSAAHPDEIQGIVLFSPGSNYNGLDALAPAQEYKKPLLVITAKDDPIAANGPAKIVRMSGSPDRKLGLLEGTGHGTALLNDQTISDVVTFFSRVLR
jgi:pimeloyl-ACP methyl ester carboxylesterase